MENLTSGRVLNYSILEITFYFAENFKYSMKKLIVLKGVSNTGKTTKINTLANWIINTYSIPNTIGLDPGNLLKNTLGILTINNLGVGINSSGDTLACVKKVVAMAEDCDTMICCCRTKGITYQYLYKNYNRKTGWIEIYLPCEKYPMSNVNDQKLRDIRVLEDLKCHLIGIEKI